MRSHEARPEQSKGQRAAPLPPAQVTTLTHDKMGRGILKANVCMINKSLVGCTMMGWGGAYIFPSFVIKYFVPAFDLSVLDL